MYHAACNLYVPVRYGVLYCTYIAYPHFHFCEIVNYTHRPLCGYTIICLPSTHFESLSPLHPISSLSPPPPPTFPSLTAQSNQRNNHDNNNLSLNLNLRVCVCASRGAGRGGVCGVGRIFLIFIRMKLHPREERGLPPHIHIYIHSVCLSIYGRWGAGMMISGSINGYVQFGLDLSYGLGVEEGEKKAG